MSGKVLMYEVANGGESDKPRVASRMAAMADRKGAAIGQITWSIVDGNLCGTAPVVTP